MSTYMNTQVDTQKPSYWKVLLFNIKVRLYTLFFGTKGFYRCLARQLVKTLREKFKTPENIARHYTTLVVFTADMITGAIIEEMFNCLTDDEIRAIDKAQKSAEEYVI